VEQHYVVIEKTEHLANVMAMMKVKKVTRLAVDSEWHGQTWVSGTASELPMVLGFWVCRLSEADGREAEVLFRPAHRGRSEHAALGVWLIRR
jgi:hypothetical protein